MPPAAAPTRRRPSTTALPKKPQTLPVHHRVAVANAHAHLFAITLTIDKPAARQRVSLPVWIPGSYLVREFAQHLQNLQATQNGEPAVLRQLDKHQWEVSATAGQPLELRYEVYAFDASVRTAYLDTNRGFFNATSLCLRVAGQEDLPQGLTVEPGPFTTGWQVATGLAAADVDTQGFGLYTAADYDELADCPFEMGAFWSGEFMARGVPHRFVVSGAGAWVDHDRLLADTRRICETQIAFWHGDEAPPFDSYLFMLCASADGYGGLEHRNSTALICQRSDLPSLPPHSAAARVAAPQGGANTAGGVLVPGSSPATPALKATDGYTTLLGLISHEYFHTWNVKRLRPAEFRRYDYSRENHTELLWFFEGFTSYYDDLMLRRAGLIEDAAYLQLIAKTINQVHQTPGRQVQSVAQASFDAWVKYYRMGENTPNATVSYYTKGSLVALCLDLTLRNEGHTDLDAVMRELWRGSQGGPIREADIARVLKRLGRRSFDAELREWVHGTADLPVTALLEAHGARNRQEKAPLAQLLGLRVSESQAIAIKTVLRGGAAEAAGLAAGDEWLAIELAPAKRGQPPEAWRVQKLEEVAQLKGRRQQLTALVARDKRLLRCTLNWPADSHTVQLQVGDAERLKRWLGR